MDNRHEVHSMGITEKEVQAIANLARLAMNEESIPGYSKQLSQILEFVAQMTAIDTDDVEPLAHPLDLGARLRADEVLETDMREAYQSGAPLVENGLYLVPKVIE